LAVARVAVAFVARVAVAFGARVAVFAVRVVAAAARVVRVAAALRPGAAFAVRVAAAFVPRVLAAAFVVRLAAAFAPRVAAGFALAGAAAFVPRVAVAAFVARGLVAFAGAAAAADFGGRPTGRPVPVFALPRAGVAVVAPRRVVARTAIVLARWRAGFPVESSVLMVTSFLLVRCRLTRSSELCCAWPKRGSARGTSLKCATNAPRVLAGRSVALTRQICPEQRGR
jgi:hypothetical protein